MTRIVTLDFETYWSSKDKYSLSKMGPIEYIRDERFFVQCVAVRVDHGPVEVMDHKHGIDLEKYHLERSDTITVGHNISGFDALVLSEHYGIKPHCCIDTIALCHWLGISRISNVSHKAITKLLGHGTKQEGTAVSDGLRTLDEFSPEERVFFLRYCHDDTLQCSENFFAMYNAMDDGKGKLDALITMMFTARMATHPAFVPDLGMLYDYVNKLDAGTEAARSKLAEFMHFATAKDMIKAIRSRSEFPKLLEQLGCQCPMKFSEKQGKNIPAISKTDLEFKKLLNHPDERVRTLVSIRLEQNSSIQRSRAVNIINLGHKPIPIPLCAFKAHTGRYTAGSESEVSDGLNFQNLSKRDPNMLTIRKSIKAPKGHKVLACDSSQIEARMLAWVAGQDDLVAQFKSGADPYAEMAAKIFHTDAKAIHNAAKNNDDPNHNRYKMYRNVGKTCILSCLAADTEVLTDTGWKPIITVSETDKLWDGTQWVNHSGLILNGKKKTINVDGVRMTQDHMILCGSLWKTASECIETRSFLNQALSTGAESSEPLQSTGILNTFASASIAGMNPKKKSTDCENVYDISNAGENHRFMIRTNSGTMIVHNCGYGVGAQKFSDTLLRSGVKLDADESKHLDIARMAHRTYRDNSQAIVNLWGICDRVLSDMLFAANRKEIVEGYAFGAHNLLKWGVKYIPCTSVLSPYVELPNGYCLWYPNLRSNGDGLVYDRFVHGKVTETKIYGGALTENCIQALAFAMLSWQACRVFMCGVPINCNIHDAWIAVVPDAIAYKCQGIIERYMISTPMWLSGFPVDCECEVGTDFTIA